MLDLTVAWKVASCSPVPLQILTSLAWRRCHTQRYQVRPQRLAMRLLLTQKLRRRPGIHSKLRLCDG